MLTYSFENTGSDSLYEHLYKCIKNDILQGVLPPGSRLPSKRPFASHLGISTITIENAYAQLMAEGYLYSIPKKGYYVASFQTPQTGFTKTPSAKTLEVSSDRSYFYADFSSTQTNPKNFPFSIWARLLREVISENSDELMTNPPSGGILRLRRAIASHLAQFRGMNVAPEQIIIGAGTEYLYGLLIQLFGHDSRYAIENPGYQKIRKIYESNEVSCQSIHMDSQGMNMTSLEESQANIVHISPSHHFPTGITMPVSRRYELLGWASAKEGRYIIEDDYDSEFRLVGKPIPALQSIDVSGNVIYMNTFTKSLASTIRVSYMVLPQPLLPVFYQKLSFYACTVSNFQQYTLSRFIEEGYFEKHINRMRNFYRLQRDQLLSCIKKSPLSSRVHITEEDSGLHFLMKIDTALGDQEFIKLAERNGIGLSCLSQYCTNASTEAEHTFIINYSSLDPEKIEEAVHRFFSLLNS